MHKAERAIIMAAGLGNRMRPLTEQIPKPMVQVNGVRMIDTVIDALHKNGITEIYVVVGHLKEAFQKLKEKYPNVVLIENPYYVSCNNISSLYVAREHLGNSIILDGDQIIYNSDILNPLFEKSGYCSMWIEEETDEWLQIVENGRVVACSKNGGKEGWQLFSVSFWTLNDGLELKGLLEEEFERKRNTSIYWDDIALFCYPERFDLGIREIQKTDIIEIDSLEELQTIDNSYKE